MNVSYEYALIMNLKNTAIDHEEQCGRNCNVSLTQLKQAAQYIIDIAARNSRISSKELLEMRKMINEMSKVCR